MQNTAHPIPRLEGLSQDSTASVFTELYRASVNLCVWQRPLPGAVHTYSEFLLTHYPYATEIRLTGNVATLSRELPQQLPRHPQGTAFIDDVCALADMLTCLLDASAIGLRLCVASQATCPRFHVDRLGCRLITTYHGPATEWLDNQNVNRDKLGRGANGKADSESGL